MDLQADFAMTVFDDEKYLGLVEAAWGVNEAGHIKVSPKDLEALVAAIRFNLLKTGTEKHTEEFVLREVFRNFDRDSNGALSKVELAALL